MALFSYPLGSRFESNKAFIFIIVNVITTISHAYVLQYPLPHLKGLNLGLRQ
jgi:hypothetical protein